ncbi:hypothetical protein EJ03DRAFT_67426 [Teratosphaeria nubilosa]|uniref:Uncharacterized protein n=1 Tax=Teratosphaeria nubilosa TaxID=161662 RepID=A0A6G1LCW8_9PEZI|nr:hypothetical protein EJ03DRAFT_67426 [Teratosphaeria nubilosa]
MADVANKIDELDRLHDDVHWFCPRSSDDSGYHYDEDCLDILDTESAEEKDGRHARIREAEERRQRVLDACQIFAFNGDDAVSYQAKLKTGLKKQLIRCEVCVREYHRARALLKAQLDEQFESDEVGMFMETFDKMNISRIGAGLDSMTATLLSIPPDKRSITSGGDVGMYALFEALNCDPFLQNEEVLRRYFDEPFRLVQTKKKVKLPSYTPGTTVLLFSRNEQRRTWAMRNFTSIKRNLTPAEFDHGVKPYINLAAACVDVVQLEPGFLPIFWRAIRIILSKCDKQLVTNNVRPMETNLYTLAMEHWQVNEDHFGDMVTCYCILLELSPYDFWEAMSGINTPTVAEAILNSPRLRYLLTERVQPETPDLRGKLAWVKPFLRSIKPANLLPPVRTILDHLLNPNNFQNKTIYSDHARDIAWQVGIETVLEALSLVKTLKSGPTITHMLELIAQDHIQYIMQELDDIQNKTEDRIDNTDQHCLDLVEALLALDVQALQHGREILVKTKALDYEIGVTSLQTWKLVLRRLKPGHALLPTSIAAGVAGVLPLEKFTPRQVDLARKQSEAWNNAFNRITRYISAEFLERLESFNPDQLVELYMEQKGARGLIALLFSGESQIHQATLSILKIMTGEDGRRDTLMHLTRAFFNTTLTAVAEAEKAIYKAEVFAPCSMFLKLCTDLFSCVCDSQDGLLRSLTLKGEELQSLEQFWQMTWTLLEMVFGKTEAWSNLGHDKHMMQEFCRQTMDFADHVFDQYSIIASTLQAGDQEGSSKMSIGKKLLKFPTKAFVSIAKWLRLRDEWLINKAVSLTSKMLGRLHEVGIMVDEKAAKFIEDVVTSTDKQQKVKTKLSGQQKAMLQRALEKHIGASIDDVVEIDGSAFAAVRKQSTLEQWTSSGPSSGTSTPVGGHKPSRPGTLDFDAWAANGEANKQRRREEGMSDKAFADLMGGRGPGQEALKAMQARKPLAPAKTAVQKKADSSNFLLKRKQEKEAQERAKAESLAKLKLGAGSGLAGLGDLGKDHTLKGQNLMLSSDEESSDSEDELDENLFGPQGAKKQKRPELETTGLKPEVKKGPVRIQRTARTLKDMRARLAPDLQPLHKIILKWDFFHEGDYPPGSQTHIFKGVQNSYLDPVSYQDTFEPLLTLEAWQGMVRAREENTSRPYPVKVQNRSNVDNFIEISTIVDHVQNREWQLSEGDVILLSKAQKPTEDKDSPHCLARISKTKRQKAHIEVVYQLMPGTSLAPSLTMQAAVWGVKVQSITPLEREYGALQALQYYDLCNQIIRAAPSRRMNFSEKQVASAQDTWNVNCAQAEAINAALENEGFSLIQGPPGSGKTKTIVAIVGGLLTQTLAGSSHGATKISMPKGAGNNIVGAEGASKKLLVCAPSNAAVDELVMRLKEGVKTKTGRHYPLNVVRIGRSEAINQQVKDVTMEELVAKRTGSNNNDEQMREKNQELFKEHSKVSAQLRELQDKKSRGEIKGQELSQLDQDLVSLRRRKNELGVRIDNVKDNERNAGREAELTKKRAQQAVLDEAHVICATLSGSGHDMFQSLNIEFETVIIDEAAQCVEMSSLIPLKYGCVKCIMVGDPKQLPPTVFSKEAAKFQYEQSLFVRMQRNFEEGVYLLDTQYRMHPDISVFPSRTFYDGLLKDGKGMAGLRVRPWHKSALLAPYRFFDVVGQQKSAGHSLINIAEIEIAMMLYDRLTTDFKTYDYAGRIGIITPYKSQLRRLKETFSQRYGNEIYDIIEFNTTDAFQGRESEIIIFSCVRASPAGGIGFLQDIRRMNVGLTRAKSSLWVLGNSESLVRGQFWRKLVEDAMARDAYTTGDLKGMLKKSSSAFPAADNKDISMYDVSSHVPQMTGPNTNGRALEAQRRPSEDVPTASKAVAPVQTATGTNSTGDRMEGVSYRFQDRLAGSKKRAAADDTNDRRRAPSLAVAHPGHNAAAFSDDEDVGMADADDLPRDAEDKLRTATPKTEDNTSTAVDDGSAVTGQINGSRSRAGTPLTSVNHGEGGAASAASRANGPPVSAKGAGGVASAALAVKKRPAASPFIQKKPKPKR